MEPQGTDPSARAPELVALLRAVAEPQRLALLAELASGPVSVGELVERTGLAQASVSHHLAVLRRARMVDAAREGRQQLYAWAPAEPGTALAELASWLERWWLTVTPMTGNRVHATAYPGLRPPRLEDHLL